MGAPEDADQQQEFELTNTWRLVGTAVGLAAVLGSVLLASSGYQAPAIVLFVAGMGTAFALQTVSARHAWKLIRSTQQDAKSRARMPATARARRTAAIFVGIGLVLVVAYVLLRLSLLQH